MAVISITLIPSTKQLVSGIPSTITVTTNISAMSFYTLDGTDPTVTSTVYTSPISLPTNQSSVVLKVFATNGVDFSSILKVTYAPDISHSRYPRAKVTLVDYVPPSCGSAGENQKALYSQPGDHPVNSAEGVKVAEDGYGYDPSIFPMRQYDYVIPIFDLLYSETNDKGETGADIGTLPAKTTIIYAPPPPEETNANRATYNPKAMVTFHDGRLPNENEYMIFRPYYEGEDLTKPYGGKLDSSTMDGESSPSGSLVSYHYCASDNTINFYYRDNRQNRWIISKEPVRMNVSPKPITEAYANFLCPQFGDGHVYRWILFKRTGII